MRAKKYKTGQCIIQLANAVTWFRNQKVQAMGLTSSQAWVIRYIQKHHNERITAGNLMEQLNLSKPTVSGIIKLLEKKSLLIRYTDEEDARKNIIVLTKKGEDLEERLEEVVMQTEDILLQGMTKEEQEQLNRLLQNALKNMNTCRVAVSQERGNCKEG